MAKKEVATKAAAPVAPVEEKAPAPRGPKGVELTAKITMLVKENPKRVGSKSRDRFDGYKDGMTVAEALAAGITTPDLIYDTAHSFVQIEGYDPKVKFTPKPKKEKTVAEPKTKKGKKSAQVEEEVEDEETVE